MDLVVKKPALRPKSDSTLTPNPKTETRHDALNGHMTPNPWTTNWTGSMDHPILTTPF